MIIEDNFVEELVECGVRELGTGVDSNSGVLVLNSRVDTSLKRNALFARHVFVFFPDFLGQALFEQRFAIRGEKGFKVIKFFSTCLIFLRLICKSGQVNDNKARAKNDFEEPSKHNDKIGSNPNLDGRISFSHI